MTQREKKLAYALVPGVLLLGWRVWAIIARLTPAPAEASPQSTAVPNAPANTSTKQSDESQPRVYPDDARLARQVEALRADWPRDPFYSPRLQRNHEPDRPSAPAASPPPAWTLTGISRCGDKRAALLAGRIVTVGSELDGGYRIIEIESDSVLIRQGNREFRYSLGRAAQEARRPESAN